MGAASSSEGSPQELSTRLSTWASSGGEDRCAAALAALDAAAPELSAALRAADAEAVTRALGAANDDADDEAAADPPASKRPRVTASFVRAVLDNERNASKILSFTGWRAVLQLEAICSRARDTLRSAKLELDVSNENTNSLTTAFKTANRHELLDARRKNLLPKGKLSFVFQSYDTGCKRRTSDVLYRDDSVFFTSPRPRQLFRADSCLGDDPRDEARSQASLASYERRRAAALAAGCVLVDLEHRSDDKAGALTRQGFSRALARPAATGPAEDAEDADAADAADDATAKALVEAMGGEVLIPRRLVLAAGRRYTSPREHIFGSRASLERAFRYAADKSAVLTVDTMRSLACAFWMAKAQGGWNAIEKGAFTEIAKMAPVGLSAADAEVAWEEACSGILVPIILVHFPPGGEVREVGDVREGDVEGLNGIDWFWPAQTALAIVTAAGGDPAKCFSQEPLYTEVTVEHTFEAFAIRQKNAVFKATIGGLWSVPLKVLDDLAFQRDGETDSAPGRARVAAAIASLLTPERVTTIAAGSAVEYGSGEPITWASATVVEVEPATATIRFPGVEATQKVGLGALRLVEERPCAAVVLLAHAIANHRNEIVMQILASPLMAAPLSFVVGEPGSAIATRDASRATVLDHALIAKNAVAIGLLAKLYAPWNMVGWRRWHDVLSTCSELDDALPVVSPDLSCALRLAPGIYRNHLNSWRDLEVNVVAEGDDVDEVRTNLGTAMRLAFSGKVEDVRALMLASIAAVATDAAAVRPELAPLTLASFMLKWAAKMGQADVISEILGHEVADLDINPAIRLAIVEGQSGALDTLLRKGPALFKFLEKFATDYTESDGLRTIIQAVELDDGATLDKLRLAGVRLGPFDQLGGAIQPLGTACTRGHAAAARAILKDPAVVQWVLARKSDAIMRACNKGSAPTLAALLERVEISHTRETPTLVTFQDTTPLIQAVISGDVATVELVLDQGVDINENRPGKKTPLSIAASKHSLEVTSLLLKRGAAIQFPAGSYASGEISCAFKYTLTEAWNYDESLSLAMVQLFLRERPNELLPDRLAEFTRQLWLKNSILQELLAAGANASASDAYGLTPLHICVFNAVATSQHNCDHFEVYKNIDTLVMARASLDAVTTRDVTEDHLVLFGHSLPRGLTPMGVARTCGREDRRDAAVAHLTAAIALRAL